MCGATSLLVADTCSKCSCMAKPFHNDKNKHTCSRDCMVLGAMLQDSDSADEIECSSEEDAVSPACVPASNMSAAKTSQRQHHDRVRTESVHT